ncbi:hypothetical protein [Streptomyces tubercidicus]|uniref:hypothetical protein n=1 Tax=Streptomyces tubercidicus TaxID=47759 RepID=UPI0036B32D2C
MTISAGSRYARNTVTPFVGTDGRTRQTIMPRKPDAIDLTVVDYTWRESDRVDLLAAHLYGDETMWWVFAQANPEILDWTHVRPGTIVRLPSGIS